MVFRAEEGIEGAFFSKVKGDYYAWAAMVTTSGMADGLLIGVGVFSAAKEVQRNSHSAANSHSLVSIALTEMVLNTVE